MTHHFSKQSWGNCWFIALNFFITGRARALLIRKTGRLAYHPIIELKSGRLLHWARTGRQLKFKLLTEGRPHIMRARELRKDKYIKIRGVGELVTPDALEASGRWGRTTRPDHINVRPWCSGEHSRTPNPLGLSSSLRGRAIRSFNTKKESVCYVSQICINF